MMLFTGGRIVRKYNTGNYESVDIELSYSVSADCLEKAATLAAEAVTRQYKTFIATEQALQKGVSVGGEVEDEKEERKESRRRTKTKEKASEEQTEKEDESPKKEKKGRSARKKKSRSKKGTGQSYPSKKEVEDFQNEFAEHWESMQDEDDVAALSDDEFDAEVNKEFKALTEGQDINKLMELEKEDFEDMKQALRPFMQGEVDADDEE